MAEQILAEISTDVGSQFPTVVHLYSWAALAPGHIESAGKRKSSRSKKGNKYLGSALTEVALSVQGSKTILLLYSWKKKKEKSSNCSRPCDVTNRILSSNAKKILLV